MCELCNDRGFIVVANPSCSSPADSWYKEENCKCKEDKCTVDEMCFDSECACCGQDNTCGVCLCDYVDEVGFGSECDYCGQDNTCGVCLCDYV